MSMLPNSFRARLALLFGGLTFLVGVPFYLYLEHLLSAQLLHERGQAIHAKARSVAIVLAENLRERQREIDLLAQTPLYRRTPFSSPEITRSLHALQRAYPHYSWLGVADAGGAVKAATGGLLLGAKVKARPWFIEGLKGSFTGDLHEAVLLASLLPRNAGEEPPRFIDFAAPVISDGGRVLGVLGAHADWRWVSDAISVIAPQEAGQPEDIYIVSVDGSIIYPDLQGDPPTLPARLAANGGYTLGHWGGSGPYLSAMVLLPSHPSVTELGWKVIVRQPESLALASLHALQERLIILGVAVALVLMVLTYAVASFTSRNLEKVARFARDIENGADPAAISLKAGTSEVRLLLDALRSMAGKLLDSQHELERKVIERTAELAEVNNELRRLARRDALTGLYNRFAANETLEKEFKRMQRTEIGYAVLLIDIDHFKRVNDTYGHEVGDLALQGVAAILRTTLRTTDFVARFGGEEFLALLPATGLNDALAVAEKVRTAVATIPAPGSGSATISIGVAVAEKQHADESEAVLLADKNLYAAKEGGRNRVVG